MVPLTLAWLPQLNGWQWGLLGSAAFILGVSRAGFTGLYLPVIVAFSVAIPGRQSAGAIQPLIILSNLAVCGSMFSHVCWDQVRRVLPAALVGVGVGLLCMDRMPDRLFRFVIGGMVTLLVSLQYFRRWGPQWGQGRPRGNGSAFALGGLAGVATMVANAATPILSLHLLRARLTKEGYAATITATFLFLNVIKFPFSCAIGLIAYPHVSLDACLVPFVLAGIYFGRCLLQTVSGPIFEEVTLVLTLVAGLSLLLPWAS